MEEIGSWFRQMHRQKDGDDAGWFLNRPSLRLAREREMQELA